MPLIFQHVGLEWPNGQVLFDDLSFSLDRRRYGLVGANGIGKSTLAKLMIGEREPTNGLVTRAGFVSYFAQSEAPPNGTLSDYLADAPVSTERWIFRFLEGLSPDRLCPTFSGGEWCRVRLARAAMSEPELLILDEPTNHLDREAREVLLEFLRHFRGGVLAISHDRELLDQMDEILELTSQGLKKYGGGWTHYEEARDHERAQLERNLETAKRLRDQSARERQERIEAQDKRQRRGAKQAERGGMPKILLGARKRRAQDTSGKIDSESRERSELAVSEAWQAYQALKFDPVIFAKLQSSKLPAQQLIFEAVDYNIRFAGDDAWLWREDLRLSIRGPKKIAIRGGNGSGKSTLLKRLASENSPHEASAHLTSAEERGLLKCGPCRFASIDQDPHWQLNAHAGQLSLLEFAREHVLSAPTAKAAVLTEPALRGGLAAFLFPGDQVHKRLHQLSGGERLRLQLALAFLSPVPPEVLLLDEPTNNLDLPNIEFLEGALNSFQGGVIIASHDEWFLSKVRLDDEIRLSR